MREPEGAQASAALIFRPETYGARGDGAADDTRAFKQMHSDIIDAQADDPNVHVIIELSSGSTYTYTWNRWTWGIKNLTLEGNGAAIRNTLTKGLDADQAILRTNRDSFSTLDYEQRGGEPEFFGYAINTAGVGSTSVTLMNAAEAANFEVGKWALVASYSQQNGGQPPNARYFDWVKVTGINGSTVRFTGDPLQHEHRDDWPSRSFSNELTTGPNDVIPEPLSTAVIVAAERDIPIGENWLIKDLTALANPNVGDQGGVVQIEGILHAEFENVNFPHWAGGQVKELIFRDSEFASSEPDKMVDLLRIENSTASISQATGINRIEIVDSYLPGRNNIQAREIIIDGSTFEGATSSWGPLYIDTFVPVYRVEVTNSTFNGVGNIHWPIVTDARPIVVTIGENGLALAGDDLTLSGTSPELWGTFQDPNGFINRAYEGQFLQLLDSAGNAKGYGEVLTIRGNGALNTARVGVDWSVTPEAGDQVKIFAVAEVFGDNNVMNNVAFSTSYDGIADVEWNGVDVQDAPWPDTSITVGERPVAGDDKGFEVTEDTGITIREAKLLRNDSDLEGGPLDILSVGHAVNGEVVLQNNGKIIFTPDADYSGPARFRYTVQDSDGNTDTARVSLDVTSIEDGLIAQDDAGFATYPNTPLIISAADLLLNDTNVDDDELTLVSVGDADNGSVEINSDGNVIFTPTKEYEGPATFTYMASDGTSDSNAASVSLFVTKILPPDIYSLWEDSAPTNIAIVKDSSSLELGVKFSADVDGAVLGLRFYKGAMDTGRHIGNLWTATGTKLATGTFKNETAGGWQELIFTNPVAIAADTTYVASYFSPTGHFAVNSGYFDQSYSHGALTAPAGGNGVFRHGASSRFPNSSVNNGNYWVDVIFSEPAPVSKVSTSGNDLLAGTNGNDTRDGLGGNDVVDGRDGDDVIEGGGGDDTLFGGDGADILLGSNGRDVLDGGPGDDILSGHANDDILTGGDGDDFLFGDAGADILEGRDGRDVLIGDAGDDTLSGHAKDDKLTGGAGDDTLFGGAGSDLLQGGDGRDVLDGGAGDDALKGDARRDVLDGGDGDDALLGGGGADILNGRGGRDLLDGGAGKDTLNGNAQDDVLTGGGGDDTLFGGAGSDILRGRDGHDILNGGGGDDILNGNAQDDVLIGGGGADRFRFEAAFDDDTVTDFSRAEGDTLFFATNLGVDTFADLDTDGSGVLDGADAAVGIVGHDLAIIFAGLGQVTLLGVTDLMRDDIGFF